VSSSLPHSPLPRAQVSIGLFSPAARLSSLMMTSRASSSPVYLMTYLLSAERFFPNASSGILWPKLWYYIYFRHFVPYRCQLHHSCFFEKTPEFIQPPPALQVFSRKCFVQYRLMQAYP